MIGWPPPPSMKKTTALAPSKTDSSAGQPPADEDRVDAGDLLEALRQQLHPGVELVVPLGRGWAGRRSGRSWRPRRRLGAAAEVRARPRSIPPNRFIMDSGPRGRTPGHPGSRGPGASFLWNRWPPSRGWPDGMIDDRSPSGSGNVCRVRGHPESDSGPSIRIRAQRGLARDGDGRGLHRAEAELLGHQVELRVRAPAPR